MNIKETRDKLSFEEFLNGLEIKIYKEKIYISYQLHEDFKNYKLNVYLETNASLLDLCKDLYDYVMTDVRIDYYG